MLNADNKILVTGAYGFIGSALVDRLMNKEGARNLSLAVRLKRKDERLNTFSLGAFDSQTDWSEAIKDCKVVVHTAGRAHFKKQSVADDYDALLEEDYASSIQLANSAAQAGVSRFIYMSSVLVNGSESHKPFTESDIASPDSPAGRVKLRIERALLDIGRQSGMDVVIIRAALVYGKDVPGNFGNLVRLVGKGIPLPLGAINNKRSLIGIDNLVDLIVTCIDHPAAGNQIFLAGDGEDLSTSELLKGLAKAMGKRSYLLPISGQLIWLAASLLGKKVLAEKLLSSQQVDITKARNMLGWRPPLSVEQGLGKCF
ncbi:NAD-dependent epimerase/dehydratase family protein [Enterovibrio sp. Hal110]